jgi:hypothetical protein
MSELRPVSTVKVFNVPLRLSLACSSAMGQFEWLTIVEELIAHVENRSQRLYKKISFSAYGIVTVSVASGIDCDFPKRIAALARDRSHPFADTA